MLVQGLGMIVSFIINSLNLIIKFEQLAMLLLYLIIKNHNRSLGQKKRKAKESIAELFINLIWLLLKWTVFLPITLLFILFKKK